MWPIVIAGGILALILIIIFSICIGISIGKKKNVAVDKKAANNELNEKKKIHCKKCGALLDANQKFCTNCGAKIED